MVWQSLWKRVPTSLPDLVRLHLFESQSCIHLAKKTSHASDSGKVRFGGASFIESAAGNLPSELGSIISVAEHGMNFGPLFLVMHVRWVNPFLRISAVHVYAQS